MTATMVDMVGSSSGDGADHPNGRGRMEDDREFQRGKGFAYARERADPNRAARSSRLPDGDEKFGDEQFRVPLTRPWRSGTVRP